jgi:hypothetical protein
VTKSASDTTAITAASGDRPMHDWSASSTGLASGPGRSAAGEAYRAAGHDAVIGEHDDPGSLEEKVNAAAVAAYRASIDNGKPISERRLAAMFGKTSRRWARHRMTEARHNSATVAADIA